MIWLKFYSVFNLQTHAINDATLSSRYLEIAKIVIFLTFELENENATKYFSMLRHYGIIAKRLIFEYCTLNSKSWTLTNCLKIATRINLVNLHMDAKIYASRSSRLFPVHFVTDMQMDVPPSTLKQLCHDITPFRHVLYSNGVITGQLIISKDVNCRRQHYNTLSVYI